MPKTFKVISIVIFFISLFPLAFSQAQTTDSIRFVTYYPSPYGSYAELRTRRMAIGNTYIQYNDTCWPESVNSPCTNNQIYTDLNGDGQWNPGMGEEDAVDLVVQGNVGIGTTQPKGNLQINDLTALATNIFLVGDTVAGEKGLRIHYSNNPVYQTATIDARAHSLQLRGVDPTVAGDAGTTGRERVFIDLSNGNVGIGTTEPGEKLSIYSGPNESDSIVRFIGQTANPNKFYMNLIGPAYTATPAGHFYTFRTVNPWINGGSALDVLTIKDTGNVGIGTSSPQQKLHIDSGGTPASPVPAIRIVDGNQIAGKVLTSDVDGNASWQTPTAGISSGGVVGAGVDATGVCQVYWGGPTAYCSGGSLRCQTGSTKRFIAIDSGSMERSYLCIKD